MEQMLLQTVTPPRLRVLSYGGGLDSFALLLAAVERRARPNLVLFADVADPDESRRRLAAAI